MTDRKLAGPAGTAGDHRRSRWWRAGTAVMLMAGAIPAAGCISVNAPDKPIVIELNINITQEVIYRLAADAGNTIEENSDIF
ncbi:YnbE family lipoprotein [Croceibacterium xixiisoli]|nr:YnbE family lipoprotein [Croceibacterium xixiisoli]